MLQAHKKQHSGAVVASSPRGSITSSCQGPSDWPRTPQHAQQQIVKHEQPSMHPGSTTPLGQVGAEDLLELPPSPSILCLSELLGSQQPQPLPACSVRAVTQSPLPFPLLTSAHAPKHTLDAYPGSHSSCADATAATDAEADSLAMQASLAPFLCCTSAALPGQLEAGSEWPMLSSESRSSLESSVCSLQHHPSMALDACPELLYLNFSE